MGNPQEPGCCVENLNLPSLSAPPPPPPAASELAVCVSSSVWLAGRGFNIPALKCAWEQVFFIQQQQQQPGYTDRFFWLFLG